jgi:hypothetical protein
VDQFRESSQTFAQPSSRQGGYAEWIALGAVVAGSIGAIIGAARCSRSDAGHSRLHVDRPDSASVTAPHGDKLSPSWLEEHA